MSKWGSHMGFKRTSEGRVFFQGADNTENDQSAQNRPTGYMGAANAAGGSPMSSAQMQTQIVTLLKTLNERLKATQADRNKMAKELEAYRSLLEDLDKKSQRSERAYMELERKVQAGGPTGKAEQIAQEALRELQETRKMLLDLEDKAERADRGVAGLKTEILEARKLSNQLIGKQTSLEKFTLEQAEKLAENATSYSALIGRIKDAEQKQQDLSEKMEQTGAEQARLMRKLDKAVEDRTRFMRKIERIEEAVIQTRESLNAKAMVLLTDQNAAGGYGVDPQSEELSAQLAALQAQANTMNTMAAPPIGEAAYSPDMPWWSKPYRMQAAGLGVIVLAALVGGWAISEMQKPALPDFGFGETETATAPETFYQPEATQTAEAPAAEQQPAAEQNQGLDMASLDWAVNTDDAQAAAEENVAQEATPEGAAEEAIEGAAEITPGALTHDDIGTLDLSKQEDVEKLLGADSQSAGEALNAIEPDTKIASAIDQQIAENNKAPEIDTSKLKNPADLIKPDSALPDVVKQIEAKAFEGVPEAMHDLGAIYTAGHGGITQDYKRAAFWFEQSAERGIANAAYNLGVLYHQGLGVKANLDTALGWYRKAAAWGHPEAQYNLGIAYIEGIGVSYDPVKAAAYFRSAADQDIMEAAYNLGLIYENGLLGNAQPDEALMWYKIAADQGSPEAKQALEQLAKSLNIKIEDVNKLAESMKAIKKSEAAPVKAAPVKASAPAQETKQAAVSSAASGTQVVTAQIQDYLERMGLYPGPSDGVMGPVTEDAIRSYQKMHGMNADGLPTQGLLTHMLANAGEESDLEQGSREF